MACGKAMRPRCCIPCMALYDGRCMRVHTARKPWCLMDGNEIDIARASLHFRFIPQTIRISQHCLPLACSLIPASDPHHSPHRPTNHVRHSPAKQFNRLQSCVFLPRFPPFLFLSHSRHPSNEGPLTQNVKRSLSITNSNADPVSFKIKTTAPKVCPFSMFDLGLVSPISAAVLRTAQLWKGRPWPDGRSSRCNISSIIQRRGLTRPAQSDAPSNEGRTATEC